MIEALAVFCVIAGMWVASVLLILFFFSICWAVEWVVDRVITRRKWRPRR